MSSHLYLLQLVVQSPLLHELGMSSYLADLASIYHSYHIAVLYSGQSVRYDDDGAALRCLIKSLLYYLMKEKRHEDTRWYKSNNIHEDNFCIKSLALQYAINVTKLKSL